MTPLMASDVERDASWRPARHRLGALQEPGGVGGAGARVPPRPPPNRASCLRAMQLFLHCVQYQLESNANYLRRCFSGLAIIIMMISISVAIASDYLSGNFAARGEGLLGSRHASSGQEGLEREKEETEGERVGTLNQ